MELALIIIRNIAIVIVGLYAIFFVIDIIFVVSFRSIMSHHDGDLCLILTNKKDNLDKLAALINKHNIKVDKKQADALAAFDLKVIEHQDGEEAKKARELLTSISEYFILSMKILARADSTFQTLAANAFSLPALFVISPYCESSRSFSTIVR